MVHPIMGLFFVIAAMGAFLAADIIENEGSEESIDGNVSKAFKAIDTNVSAKLAEIEIEDPDLNKAVQAYLKGTVEAAKGSLALGVSVGKKNSALINFWAIPLVVLVLLFCLGFPTFKLVGCGILVAYDKVKDKRYSKPKIEQRFLK